MSDSDSLGETRFLGRAVGEWLALEDEVEGLRKIEAGLRKAMEPLADEFPLLRDALNDPIGWTEKWIV